MSSQEGINIAKTTSWSANKYMTSQFEGYAHALYEQVFNTKDLQYRREKKAGLQPKHNNDSVKLKLRISRMLFPPVRMSTRYYLPLQHDTIAEAIYTALRKKRRYQCKNRI